MVAALHRSARPAEPECRQQGAHSRPVDRLRFYQFLYRQPGYVEVVAGTNNPGNPDEIDLLVLTQANFEQCKHDQRYMTRKQRFLWVDPADADSIAALDQRVSALEAKHGNVYVSVFQYREQNRQSPLPTNVVLVEDAPANPTLPYSLSVQTSPGSRHGYYELDQAVNEVHYRQIATRLAAALAADMSGVDAQQLVRVPGTRNTKAKYGEHERVHLAGATGTVYSRSDLETAYQPPAAQPGAERARWATQAGYQTPPDIWERASRLDVARGGPLLNERGVPRKLKGDSVQWIARLITGDQTLTNEQGELDTSKMRWHVIKALVLRGYDDDEIAAIAWEVAAWRLGEKRSADNIEADILRCISLLRAEYPHIQINRTDQYTGRRRQTIAQSDRPRRASRARADRPATVDAESVYAYYVRSATAGAGKHISTRKADAAALGISTATLDRIDARLKASGRLAITIADTRRYRVVGISDQNLGVINIATDDTQHGALTADVDNTASGVAMPKTGDEHDCSVQRDHPAPDPTPDVPPAGTQEQQQQPAGGALSPDADATPSAEQPADVDPELAGLLVIDPASLGTYDPDTGLADHDRLVWTPELDELTEVLPASWEGGPGLPPDPGPPLHCDDRYWFALGADPAPISVDGGATFDPADAVPQRDGAYTARRKDWLSLEAHYRKALEGFRVITPDPALEQAALSLGATPPTAPARTPRKRVPPRDRDKQRTYYKLLNRAKTARSPAQADLLRARAAELEEEQTPVYLARYRDRRTWAVVDQAGVNVTGWEYVTREQATQARAAYAARRHLPADAGTDINTPVEQPAVPAAQRPIPLQGAAKRNLSVAYHLQVIDAELARIDAEQTEVNQ